MLEFNKSVNEQYESLSQLNQTLVVSGVVVTVMMFSLAGFLVASLFIGSRLWYNLSK